MHHIFHYIYVMRFGDVLVIPFFQERYLEGVHVYTTRTFPRKAATRPVIKQPHWQKSVVMSPRWEGYIPCISYCFFLCWCLHVTPTSFYRKGTSCLGLLPCKLLRWVTICILQITSIVQCNLPGVVYLLRVTIIPCLHRRGTILNVHYYLMDGLETRELLLRTTVISQQSDNCLLNSNTWSRFYHEWCFLHSKYVNCVFYFV